MNQDINDQPKTIDVRPIIETGRDLFALPDAAVKILQLSEKDEVSLEVLAKLISRDPALTGRLLKISNSASFGLNRKVTSIQHAVVILGLTAVKCLVLSAALFDPFKISNVLRLDIKGFYSNIISVATTCRKLAEVCGYKNPGDAFTCGLLYEIGMLFFMQNYPKQYRMAIDRAMIYGDLVEEEKRTFGVSHMEAGRLIAARWKLPEEFISAIANHHSFGFRDSAKLDDIVRLSVALSLDYSVGPEISLEEKIAKISSISARLGVSNQQLDEITVATIKETLEFARALDIDIGDFDTVLSRANQEIFKTYMSIQKLFKERQELTRNILTEERQQGIQEAKQVAISTLSHYINNASMIIFGQSQVLRMMLDSRSKEDIVGTLPKSLDMVDDSIKKIVAVLEEISELNMLDDVEYFEQSKIINIDDRIQERLTKLAEIQANGHVAELRPSTR